MYLGGSTAYGSGLRILRSGETGEKGEAGNKDWWHPRVREACRPARSSTLMKALEYGWSEERLEELGTIHLKTRQFSRDRTAAFKYVNGTKKRVSDGSGLLQRAGHETLGANGSKVGLETISRGKKYKSPSPPYHQDNGRTGKLSHPLLRGFV